MFMTVPQFEAERRGERVYSYMEMCAVARKVERGSRLSDEETKQWGWVYANGHEELKRVAKQHLADAQRIAFEVATIPGAREFYAALGQLPPQMADLPLVDRSRPRTARRQRTAARRAAGPRSGSDPPPEDPEPESALSAAVTAPAHALNDGNSPYTRADRARGSRPLFVLYARHPVHGLINRPLGRFLAGQR